MFSHTWTINFVLLFLTFWITLYLYFTRRFSHWKNKNVPYLPPIPFFGNAIEVFTFQKNLGEMCRTMYERSTKPFLGFFICDEPYLLIRDPELVKFVLVKDFALFSNRTVTENKKDDPMGAHILFILKNPDWKNMRKKISPVFTPAKMKSMFRLMYESTLDMIHHLKKMVEVDPVVEIREVTAKYTTNAITSTAFGIDAKCFKDENSEFRKVSRRALNWSILERAIATTCYFIAPKLVKLFKLKFVDTESANFLRNAFWKTMIEREKSNFIRNDLLDILIEIRKQEAIDDPYKLEGDRLVAQATQFFLAGYETSSTSITFTLYELARNHQIQDKVRKEAQEVLNKYGGELTYDALNELVYLEMCIKESLRKYPVLAFLDRRCEANYQIPGTDIILEKDTPIFIPSWGLHYDPKYYPYPDKYDPERFTEENIKSRPPFTYLPFGEGPRNCIGARFALVSSRISLVKILSTFRVDICDKTPNPLIIDHKGFLIAPKGELHLKCTKL